MPKALNLIGEKYNKLTVIEKAANIKGRTAWKCQCECGEFTVVTTKDLRNSNVRSCGCLKRKDLVGQKFGKLTIVKATKDRRHGSVVWECKCECGNTTYATTEGLRTGDNVSCGCRNLAREKFSNTYKIDLTNKRFGKLLVLESTEQRSKKGEQIWKCQCDCGNICLVTTNHLTTGNTQSCGCKAGCSLGEQEIKTILEQNNIKFKQEFIFSDLPNRRYDFALLDKNDKVIQLIEFDGEQHYIDAPFFNTTLEEQRKIDEEKTLFAKSKGIKLIRIPYWKRGKLELNDLEVNLNELSQ